jgi:biopolymer transport protein ExbD
MIPNETTSDDREIGEINMTPLIDVSLVLVVILLLATPFAYESSLSVQHAAESAQNAVKTEQLEQLELNLISEEEVRVNRDRVARAALAEALLPLLRGDSPPQVVVACADGVSHGAFVNVLDQAKSCGAVDIAVVGK